jgi:Sulfotransferase domain
VERLWDPKYNPDRLLWDVYPFTNKVHTALYGRPDFDADVFLARYRRHNQEVLAYFKNRPQDLLVMDMSAGAGWPELCGFLGLPIPAIDYPKANHTNGPATSRLEKWWYGSRKGPSTWGGQAKMSDTELFDLLQSTCRKFDLEIEIRKIGTQGSDFHWRAHVYDLREQLKAFLPEQAWRSSLCW